MRTIPALGALDQTATPPHALSGSVERQGAHWGSAAEENAAPGAREERAGGSAAGLVTSAKTVRISKTAGSGYYFPTAGECQSGAGSVGAWAWDGREGAVPALEVYPGLVRLTAQDLNRKEARENRALDRPAMVPAERQDGEPGRMITSWSARSRARMVATMAELDLAPLLMQPGRPAMVTLTYPGGWETVAPDGPTVKGHLTSLFKRFERAWGTPWMGIWKLEFQGRGAPHFHLLMVPPSGLASSHRWAEYQAKLALWEQTKIGPRPRWRASVGDGQSFRDWLSLTWADVVGHPDPEERRKHVSAGTGVDYAEGDRARDPKRAAVYFGKHGSFADKDYQHNVPACWLASGKSVGRFWGYRGLEKVKGAATITFDEQILLGRTLRKLGTRTKVYDSETGQHFYRPVLRTVYRPRRKKPWVSPAGVEIAQWKMRRQTVRARRMTGPMNAGFLLVNDGPGTARVLARVLETCGLEREEAPAPVGLRGPIRERAS